MPFDEQRNPQYRGRRRDDQILEGWTWSRVTKIATALTVVGGATYALVGFLLTILVTRPQLEEVTDSLHVIGRRTDLRVQRIEARQDAADDVHRLLIPMARLQCLDLVRQRSASLGDAAGLPCDSLLRRMTPR